jgi:nucleotidyltransferase/DNA polymerase involved in DNA repair
MDKQQILNEFQMLPGVGKSISEDLWDMGFRSKNDLKKKDPQKLYDDFNKLRGQIIDRCMLYTFRCIVYAISNTKPDPKLLKWWNWSDKNLEKNQ